MKTGLYSLAAALVAVSAVLCGEVIEVNSFADIPAHIPNRSLIIVDMDDTIFVPNQLLGTFEWFQYRLQQNMEMNCSGEAALTKTQKEWSAVQLLTEVHLVEPCIGQVIDNIGSSDFQVLGITSRSWSLGVAVMDQLASLGINFYPGMKTKSLFFEIGSSALLYKQGILYTDWKSKWNALSKLFKLQRIHPRCLVYISRSIEELNEAESMAEEENIKFVGFHYDYLHRNAFEFRSDLADAEWVLSSFGHIITDAEAQEYLDYLSPK